MKKAATSKNALFDPASLPHLADLIDYGEITVGVVEPVGGGAGRLYSSV